jgi:glycosyltransferase involved in cell wall biosynthesis
LSIVFLCYPLSDRAAPHAAMAALALARQGHVITFIAWGNEAPPAWLSDYDSSIRYLLFPKYRWFSALRLLFGVIRVVWTVKPECVYIQGAQQTPFVLWLLYTARRRRLIYHTQDYVGRDQSRFYVFCERRVATRADWVISNEPNRARFMASSYGLKRVPEVIRTALPRWWRVPGRDETCRGEVLKAAGLSTTDQPRLIAAGGPYRSDRMSPQLIEALAHLPRHYVVVFTSCPHGSAPRRSCTEHLERLGLEGRAIFWSAPSFEQLLQLFSACDVGILLYPNSGVGHFYQSPGRLTEYLRCGLPVVTSHFPSLELLVMRYGLGEVADPYSPTSIAGAIRRVCEVTDGEFHVLRRRLRELAESELAYETQAQPVFEKVVCGAATTYGSGPGTRTSRCHSCDLSGSR